MWEVKAQGQTNLDMYQNSLRAEVLWRERSIPSAGFTLTTEGASFLQEASPPPEEPSCLPPCPLQTPYLPSTVRIILYAVIMLT